MSVFVVLVLMVSVVVAVVAAVSMRTEDETMSAAPRLRTRSMVKIACTRSPARNARW